MLKNAEWVDDVLPRLTGTRSVIDQGIGVPITSFSIAGYPLRRTFDGRLFHATTDHDVIFLDKKGYVDMFSNRITLKMDPLMMQSPLFQFTENGKQCSFVIRAGVIERLKHFTVQQPIPSNPREMEILLGTDSLIYVLIDQVIVLKSDVTFTVMFLRMLNAAGARLEFFTPTLFDAIDQTKDFTCAIVTESGNVDGVLYQDKGIDLQISSGNLFLNSTNILTGAANSKLYIHMDRIGDDIEYFIKKGSTVVQGSVTESNITAIAFGPQILGSFCRADIGYSVEALQFVYENHEPRSATMTNHTFEDGVLTFNNTKYTQVVISFSDEAATLFGISELRENTQGNRIVQDRNDHSYAELYTFPTLHFQPGESHTVHDDIRTLNGQVFYTDQPMGARNVLLGTSRLFFQIL